MMVREHKEVGVIINNTSYDTRFYDGRQEMRLRTQTMLVSKMDLKRGDYVMASVRLLRSSRQIVALKKIDISEPASLFFEFIGTRATASALLLSMNEQRAQIRASLAAAVSTAKSLATHKFSSIDGEAALSYEVITDFLRDISQDDTTPEDGALRRRVAIDLAVDLTMADVIRTSYEDNVPFIDQLYISFVEREEQNTAAAIDDKPSDSDFSNYEWLGDVWVPEDLRPLLPIASSALGMGDHLNVLLTGPSGYGKTTFFKGMAEWLGVKLVYVNCATITDVNSWFGTLEARGGETVFDPTDFTKAMEEGNCIIVLDEANRLEPWLTNSLMPILDHRRETTVHHRIIKCGPGIIFGLTMNQGSRYAGASVSDAAFVNRMDVVAEVSEPSEQAEVRLLDLLYGHNSAASPEMPMVPEASRYIVNHTEAKRIVDAVRAMRTFADQNDYAIDVSTRTTGKIGKLMSYGASLLTAIRFAIVYAVDRDIRKGLLDVLAARKIR